MLVASNGDFKLGPNTISGCHQNRVRKPRRLKIKQATKTAKLSISAGAHGGAGQRANRLHQRVACVDIDSSVSVGQALWGGVRSYGVLAAF